MNLDRMFSRVIFFDLAWSREEKVDLSRVNTAEADFTFQLIQTLIDVSHSKSLVKQIGVVTPYKG
jgi:hypothetical protein